MKQYLYGWSKTIVPLDGRSAANRMFTLLINRKELESFTSSYSRKLKSFCFSINGYNYF